MRKIWMVLFLALALVGATVGKSRRALAAPVPVGQVVSAAVAISNGGTTSAAIKTSGMSLVGIQFPATMTSTAVTFTVSSDGTTFVPLYNSSGALSYTIAGGRFLAINPADFYGATYFKIVLGSSEGAARSLTAILKGI